LQSWKLWILDQRIIASCGLIHSVYITTKVISYTSIGLLCLFNLFCFCRISFWSLLAHSCSCRCIHVLSHFDLVLLYLFLMMLLFVGKFSIKFLVTCAKKFRQLNSIRIRRSLRFLRIFISSMSFEYFWLKTAAYYSLFISMRYFTYLVNWISTKPILTGVPFVLVSWEYLRLYQRRSIW